MFYDAFKLWNTEDLSGLSYNARVWLKFERPKKRLRFLRALEFGRARTPGRAQARSTFCDVGGYRSVDNDLNCCIMTRWSVFAKSA